ncbi:MAG: hypothetical protein Q7O66_14935 [Dehalococcoidia bacterium]|nr:hypothetical protein [Dehalococcoidia bacterium]
MDAHYELCIQGIKGLYKHPVVVWVEGVNHTPVLRLIPVRGQEAEAMELVKRMELRVKPRRPKEG